MEFEDQEEEQEGDLELGSSYNDSTRPVQIKMPTPLDVAAPSPPPPPSRKSRYRECQKNHAVGIGAHAVDGCGEFIAAGEDGTLESLKCAACNCHRNFHRKEPDHGGAYAYHQHPQQHLIIHPHPHNQGHFGYRTPGGYHHHMAPSAPQQRAALLALPSNSGGGGSGEDLEDNYYSNPSSSGKKRYRTKFSQEQKDKMLSFAERLGWRIQKQDEEIVLGFCNELGIKRHVLKVWMHNNKHTLGGKKTTSTIT